MHDGPRPNEINWSVFAGVGGGKVTAQTVKSSVQTRDWLQPPVRQALDFQNDRTSQRDDTAPMTEITREEFNAKLETIETKMDARVESVSAKIECFIATQAERDKRLEATIAQIATSQAETKSGLSSMKNAMLITAISTVLAIVFGVASFNTALTANMMLAFQLGKGDSPPPPASATPATVPRVQAPGPHETEE